MIKYAGKVQNYSIIKKTKYLQDDLLLSVG